VTMSAPMVETDQNRIVLNFDSLDQALQLLKPWAHPQLRADAARKIHGALEAVGLQLEVRVKGVPVAQMGSGDFHGSLLALLGVSTPR